jgi:hypothetical protein
MEPVPVEGVTVIHSGASDTQSASAKTWIVCSAEPVAGKSTKETSVRTARARVSLSFLQETNKKETAIKANNIFFISSSV